jgi:hypothetical protein
VRQAGKEKDSPRRHEDHEERAFAADRALAHTIVFVFFAPLRVLRVNALVLAA